MPEGYTYENQAGGWSMCDNCGVRVSDEEKHTASHRAPTIDYQAIADELRKMSPPPTPEMTPWEYEEAFALHRMALAIERAAAGKRDEP